MDAPPPEGQPVAYRAFVVGKDGRIQNVTVIQAADEARAIEIAHQMAAGHVIELWDRSRMIGRFEPQGK